MRKMTKEYKVLVRKSQRKRQLGRPWCRWEKTLKWISVKWDVRFWTGLNWLRIQPSRELL
jgi:hypothetical protein